MPRKQAHNSMHRHRTRLRGTATPLYCLVTTRILVVLCGVVGIAQAHGAAAANPVPPLVIEADRLEMNDKTGLNTYTGNVLVTRGAMHLNCDTLTVHNVDGKVQQSECEGKPATFRRDPEENKPEVQGHANQVEYYLEDERLVLQGDAYLEQGRDTYSGQHIIYYLQRDVVNADTPKQNGGRVRITIQPERDEGAEDTRHQ
jgi:lipopolysaccharide export system protein LptA